MNHRFVFEILGKLLKYYSLVFLPSLGLAYYYGENIFPYIISSVITLASGLILEWYFRGSQDFMGKKEGYAVVALTWLFISVFGAIPYIFNSISPVDAFFEAMSGFTTTGSTIIPEVEALPRSLLFWRSFTQWIGGMGIIVMFVAFFPAFSVRGGKLLPAEAPGPTMSRIRPRVRDTAKSLYLSYLVITLAEIAVLYAQGVDLFDAVNHAFTTLATGGFSTHTESLAFFSPGVQWTVIIFMILAGTNFTLHYYWMRGNAKILKNPEFRLYILFIFLGALSLMILNSDIFNGIEENARHSFFQAVSIMTTTGYATHDFDKWKEPARMILLLLMFIGGCSGSTGGGMKVVRIYLIIKYAMRELSRAVEPRVIKAVRYGDKTVPDELLNGIMAFSVFYVSIFLVSSILLSFSGLDFITSVSASAATLGNVGPGLGAVGPTLNFAGLHPLAKILLSMNMWIGRLEIFTVLSIFIPGFWRERW